MAARNQLSPRATWVIAAIAMLLPLLGIFGILVYTGFAATFGVGLLAALASAGVGLVLGLLFGVPKAISSGQVRLSEQVKQVQIETKQSIEEGSGEPTATSSHSQPCDQTSRFTPSTNLAEVSDWLTKLLLGAGLVSLTKIGAPLGHLIDSISRGLSSDLPVPGSAVVAAGAIVFGYVAMGFLDGYMLTTLWYQRQLDET